MKKKLRILHLEDSPADSELIQHLLNSESIDCEVVRLDTREEFLAELDGKKFDLIFADSSLPSFSGRQALELSRIHAPDAPFIFISGTMGEDTAIESLRNGATDYVLKDRLSRLVPAVRRALAEAAERTKNLDMEQRLRQAQRLEAIGTLAGGVAHDFNNILTIIKGHTTLLLMESDRPNRVQEVAATIDHAAQRGSELVGQLLAFARKSDGSFTSTNINQRLREITSMLKQAFPRNISFAYQIDESLPEIHADPGQVERVLVNLSTNARDAMPDGGKITFSTTRVQANEVPLHSGAGTGSYLCLCVTDTGTGMDEATRQHIFEPFFTTKPKGQGTGLGMPVVYGLMQSHNGLIDIQSAPSKGTSISLFFPIPENPAPHLAEQPVAPPEATLGTETIMVVDDEADVRYFLEVVLKDQGYNVISASDAEEALEILARNGRKIHLLFADLGLPKLDGFELSSRARQYDPVLKTILASGYADATIKTKMVELGIDAFIAKPYDIVPLLQNIRAVLDKE